MANKEKGIRTSLYTKEYIRTGLSNYCYNNRESMSGVINTLLEDFLKKEGYLDEENNVSRSRDI